MTPGTHRCSVYGVGITSDWPFAFSPPLLRPLAEVDFAQGTDDDFSELEGVRDPDAPWCLPHAFVDGSTYACWSGLYDFRIAADGSRIVYRPLQGCDRRVLQNYLFGQALSFALVFQGLEPLHAAAVGVDGEAIAFLGDCTIGKSTLLAAFLRAGHRLLTDDLLMLAADGSGRLAALPGSGRIKLHPDSAEAFLNGDADPGEPLNGATLKRSFRLDAARFQSSALPLRAVFILPKPGERKRTTAVEIEPLSPAALFTEVLKSAFNSEILTRDRLQRQFARAGQMAESVRGFRLHYPDGFHHLHVVGQRIVDHVRQPDA